MGVHLCGRCLQPRQNAESGLYASSFCISLGRSVSKRQKTGVWIAEFLQKRSDLKPNSPAQAVARGTSSRQPSFFRILLNVSNVNSSTFGKLKTFNVDGQVYAQPLYVPKLTINGGVHNVLYVATMHNSVFAFDADTGDTLFYVNLGAPVPAAPREGPQPCPYLPTTGP